MKETLYRWFLSNRRWVQSRTLPRLVLAKAKALKEDWVHEHVASRGLPAVAGSVNYMWLSRWKKGHWISLRQPSRKWTVPLQGALGVAGDDVVQRRQGEESDHSEIGLRPRD